MGQAFEELLTGKMLFGETAILTFPPEKYSKPF